MRGWTRAAMALIQIVKMAQFVTSKRKKLTTKQDGLTEQVVTAW